MPTSELGVSIEYARKNMIVGSGADPTLTQKRIRQVLELPNKKKKDWRSNRNQPPKKSKFKDGFKPSTRYLKTKGAELTFDDIMLILYRGPEDKMLWTAKRLERSKAVRAEFEKMDDDDSQTIHVSTELVAGLEELTGAGITDDHARALAGRVHAQQSKDHVERNIDPDLLDYSQFCFLVAMVKHEEDAWQEYAEARKYPDAQTAKISFPCIRDGAPSFRFSETWTVSAREKSDRTRCCAGCTTLAALI
jgi:hypothetical protein